MKSHQIPRFLNQKILAYGHLPSPRPRCDRPNQSKIKDLKFEKRPMKTQKLSQIKPNQTTKVLATVATRMVLALRAMIAGESGVDAASRSCGTPQSITQRGGQAVGNGGMTKYDQRYTNKNQSKVLAFGDLAVDHQCRTGRRDAKQSRTRTRTRTKGRAEEER